MTTVERLTAALADRYRIERELGAGGMATVYLAEDLKHQRKVAVKVLRPELAAALGAERFLREITITARLDHPNILPLLDSGQADSFLYYVMPFVVGESLRDRLAREKQLPVDVALQIAREVADALDYAHSQGLIHRDIKPDNIMLSGGHARVADFGIARALSTAGGDKLTSTGMAVGTPTYMSPEQSVGESDLDGRSDLYALGCVLYEMLTGEPPYTGASAQAIIAKRMTHPVPSVRVLRETVPESVDRALMTAMAKSPADRFATTAAFAAALTDAGSRQMPSATQPSRSARRWWFLPAVLVPALTVIGVLLVVYSRRPTITPGASVIAVLPFLPSGPDTALVRLGRDLALTISANLEGVGGIRIADPHQVLSRADGSRSGQWLPNAIALGKSLGAGSVVLGNIVRAGSDVRLDLKLFSTSGDSVPLARVSVSNSPDSISALTDSVTWSVLRQVWRRGDPPSPSYEELTTRSVLSLRAFLDGERLSEAGNWSAAADAYAAAIKADSTFWLAGWRFNSTQGWTESHNFNADLTRGYESHLSAFGERDRLLIEAEKAAATETLWAQIARLRALTERFPSDWVVWFQYADALVHSGGMAGHTNAETRAALRRTVDLNPKLVSMWEHLVAASLGHDSAQAATAVKSYAALGGFREWSEAWGFDASLLYRLPLSTNGPLHAQLRDSLIAGVSGSKELVPNLFGRFFVQNVGFPAVQVELNRRLLALDPAGPFTALSWAGMASAWASRGAWDSALAARDSIAAASGEPGFAVYSYRLAVVGAWLEGLDITQVPARRAAALQALGRFTPEDSGAVRNARAKLAWADGMLAVMRRDPRALATARAAVRQSGDAGAGFLDRALAGFELELHGDKRSAADSLAALELAGTESDLEDPRDPTVLSIDHLKASEWLLALGDTARAVRLLYWHESDRGDHSNREIFQIFAALAYYELARIEEAQGRTEAARDHYEQFLRRYDMPAPAHQHLVDEAKAALRKFSGQDDAPHTQ